MQLEISKTAKEHVDSSKVLGHFSDGKGLTVGSGQYSKGKKRRSFGRRVKNPTKNRPKEKSHEKLN